jgi:endonuclease/exonuclease/phosphatase (EEP) superfamily protein YafD
VWVGVLAMMAVAMAHVVAFDREHLLMLVNAYALWILLPAYLVTVAALCFRAWPLAIAALVVVIAHLVWVVPPMVRSVPVSAAAVASPHVRIASANLRYDNHEHAGLINELEHVDADIIVLEEVTPSWWHAIARSSLVTSYPVSVKELRDDPGGMAVLSRHPVTDVEVHRAGGWPIITATAMLGGRPVHLLGVHLVAPLETFERNQRAQRSITTIARHLERPRLLVGDFNASPYNRWLQQLSDLGLRDAHESVGRPFATTWPNGRHLLPPLLLDHLLADPTIVPIRVREGRGAGSDHRPIVVDLAVVG